MSDVWGSNPAQLRELAQLCSQGSTTITAASTALGAAINNPFMWRGSDADRVRQQWNGSMRLHLFAATDALEKVSAELLGHADEQETASDEGGGAGSPGPGGEPGGSGPGAEGPGDDNPLHAGWDSFTQGWNAYGALKAIPNMAAGLYDLRLLHALGLPWNRATFDALRSVDVTSDVLNTTSDFFDGNLHTALGLADGTKAATAFSALGNTLGVVGVGMDLIDAGIDVSKGDYGGAAYSTTKAALGIASFAPPPVGTAAMVASGALALYDNVPFIHHGVNAAGAAIAHGVTAAAGAVGDAADAVGDTLADGAEAVGDFFGF
jgi:hypothetical protein